MNKLFTTTIAALSLTGGALATVQPAAAQDYRDHRGTYNRSYGGRSYYGNRGGYYGNRGYYGGYRGYYGHRDDDDWAYGALGFGLGAALGSAYGGTYYNYPPPAYYAGPTYYDYYGGCRQYWRWDGYYGRYVLQSSCY